jgi:ribosomal protein S27E
MDRIEQVKKILRSVAEMVDKADQIDAVYQLEIAELKERVDAWENLEASVCPEDVGLVEYIKSLVKKVEKLKEQWEWSQGALDWRESEISKAREQAQGELSGWIRCPHCGSGNIIWGKDNVILKCFNCGNKLIIV